MKYELRPEDVIEKIEEQEELDPPKLERQDTSEEFDVPPKMEKGSAKLGESRDAFNKRIAFESSTNQIEAEYRARDYKKQLEEDKQKEAAYREKLYGK